MDYTKTLQQFKEYYSNTLIVQYHDKPKAKQTIEMLVKLVYSNMLLMQIRDAFDWKTAVGEQLDIIGKWVGVSRVYNVNLLTEPKLSYPQYSRLDPIITTSDLQGGYSDYETFNDNDGGQLRYNDLQSIGNKLDDNNYRMIIGLKIIYNSINHVAGEIDKAIYDFFGGEIITKWSDFTLTYEYTDKYTQLMAFAEYKGVLPAPIGVTVQLRKV